MKRLFKSIFKIIFLVLFIIALMTGIDYYRMRIGEVPVFNNTYYSSKTRVQVYKGIFYTANRVYYGSPREPLEDSSNIHFYLFSSFLLPLPEIEKTKEVDFQIVSTQEKECLEASKLYYADLNQKVYLYCISDIDVIQKQKKESLSSLLASDSLIINNIEDSMSFLGIEKDGSTMTFQADEGDLAALGLKLYQCNSFQVNDVYIGPKSMEFQPDFCTYKDDDFSFIYEIADETPEGIVPVVDELGNTIFETFFEDQLYWYQFDIPKSSYVFITTPAVRGKEATRTPLINALNTGLVTIQDLEDKGLQFEKIAKEQN